MRAKALALIVGALTVVTATGVSGASAATEVGNRCAANASAGEILLVSLANAPGNPLPATIPSGGVITRWSFSLGLPSEIPLSETLRIFRPTGASKQFQVIGESAPTSVTSGTQTFSTRIPVQAGDLISALAAAGGSTGSVFCETGVAGDRVGVAPVGSTVTASEEEGLQNPIVVFVEPDADKDGYGDETQDKCPQSAALQEACPLVTLSASPAVKKALASILITTSTQATVTVAGKVTLGKGKSVKLSGGSQIVAPGTLAKFILLFPKKLQTALAELPRKRSLTLVVTATAPNIVGAPTIKTLRLHLAGKAKTKKPSHKKRN
jgi:hypothetical protein